MKETKVELSKIATKQLEKLPKNIVQSLLLWVFYVENNGIQEVRKIAGYHDEPLRGDRIGQRSVRLNNAYRAFYIINTNGEIEIITVIEVNKHKY